MQIATVNCLMKIIREEYIDLVDVFRRVISYIICGIKDTFG